MERAFRPGATIGVLGGGQLGRMLGLAARRAGYRFHVLTDAAHSPAAQVADDVVVADYADVGAVAAFAARVDVVTLEFENVAVGALEAAARLAPVRPGALALSTCQDRRREKEFLRANGFPHAAFTTLAGPAELADLGEPDYPLIAKTAGYGYDGKGQVALAGPAELPGLLRLLGAGPVVVEARVELAAELSVVGARALDGQVVLFDPFVNRHVNGVLDVTLFGGPSGGTPVRDLPWERLRREAAEATEEVMRLLDFVGVACVEFFVTTGGDLLVNEIAPRPHNSGHLTIEACVTSQFEQQWRAVCGMPLGDPTAFSPAAMANLLGDAWARGEPRWDRALAEPAVALHLYGKREARAGRKMGHLTALAATAPEAERRVVTARAALVAPGAQDAP